MCIWRMSGYGSWCRDRPSASEDFNVDLRRNRIGSKILDLSVKAVEGIIVYTIIKVFETRQQSPEEEPK